MSRTAASAGVLIGAAALLFGGWMTGRALFRVRVPPASDEAPAAPLPPTPPEPVPVPCPALELPVPSEVTVLRTDLPPSEDAAEVEVVRGTVRRPDGSAAAGAECTLSRETTADGAWQVRTFTARTGADGKFAFAIPGPRGDWDRFATLEVVAAGFPRHTERRLDCAADEALRVVWLKQGVRVVGRCVDEAGAPIVVHVRSGRSSHESTHYDGTFDLVLVADSAPLRLVPEAHEPRELSLPPGRVEVDLGTLTFPAARDLSGVVVDERGVGFPGAVVHVTRLRTSPEWAQTLRADGVGRFVAKPLPPGPYALHAETDEADEPTPTVHARPGDPPLRLVARRGSTIRFRLLRAADRTPVRPTFLRIDVSSERTPPRVASRAHNAEAPLAPEFLYAVGRAGTYSALVVADDLPVVRIDRIEVGGAEPAVVDVLLGAPASAR